MKKIISVLCVVALIAAISWVVASAADPLITFTLVPQNIEAGATEFNVTLRMSVSDGSSVHSFGIMLDYDAEKLALESSTSSMTTGSVVESESVTANPYKFVWAGGTEGLETGNYTVATFKFSIIGGAAAGTDYAVNISAAEDGNVLNAASYPYHDYLAAGEVGFNSAVVSIPADSNITTDDVTTEPTPPGPDDYMIGDLDGNEKCDSNDVIVLLRKLAGWENVTTAPDEAADVDGSGKVDSNDAIYYLRSLAGWADHDIG